jgi:hypothetical protein
VLFGAASPPPALNCPRVAGMSEELNDPSANTMAWQAWVDKEAATSANEGGRSQMPIIIAGAIALVAALGVLVYLLV